MAKTGNMIAAKYRIEGSISSIVKRSSDYKDVFYKFSPQLIDVDLAEWMDEGQDTKLMNHRDIRVLLNPETKKATPRVNAGQLRNDTIRSSWRSPRSAAQQS